MCVGFDSGKVAKDGYGSGGALVNSKIGSAVSKSKKNFEEKANETIDQWKREEERVSPLSARPRRAVAAFFDIYKMYKRLHRSEPNISANVVEKSNSIGKLQQILPYFLKQKYLMVIMKHF